MSLALVVDKLTVKYGEMVAVNEVSFSIKKGDIFGLLGPNGSGKTTMIKALCGLLPPNSGKVVILDMDVYKNAYRVKEKIGYMSQKFNLYADLTVRENIDFYAGIYGLRGNYAKQRKAEILELMSLQPHIDKLAKYLSGGWKQRLALACAIIHQPEFVFLDEPTAGIDSVARRDIWELLFQLSGQGITFLVTTHYMDEAERCVRIGYLYYSKLIACGTFNELRVMPEVAPKDTINFEITCQAPSSVHKAIKNFSYIREATIFGENIHILMDSSKSIEELVAQIHKLGLGQVSFRPLIPSLEDVFVRLTKSFNQKAINNNG